MPDQLTLLSGPVADEALAGWLTMAEPVGQ
jgi:hypothetical protein